MAELNQKETTLLEDLKSSEQLCIEKYTKYENNAANPRLKTLMSEIRAHEQNHLDTICKVLNGETPQTSTGACAKITPPAAAEYGSDNNAYNNDKYICSDALTTEKHVSSTYNTVIFEMRDTTVRDALNHIQKEEQEHGENIYTYMSQNGMYS